MEMIPNIICDIFVIDLVSLIGVSLIGLVGDGWFLVETWVRNLSISVTSGESGGRDLEN